MGIGRACALEGVENYRTTTRQGDSRAMILLNIAQVVGGFLAFGQRENNYKTSPSLAGNVFAKLSLPASKG